MPKLTVTSYPPARPKINNETIISPEENKKNELLWLQKIKISEILDEAIHNLKECCVKLNLGSKCDERMNLPLPNSTSEKYNLVSRQGTSDHLKASLTLLDDNVIQAEVVIKNPKVGGGFYRAIAQPDVQWKLQQLQDLGNHIVRVSFSLTALKAQTTAMINSNSFTEESGKRMLEEFKSIKNEIGRARESIQLPRKRSLLELCYFPPTRKFVPPLPQDQLLSFYISSCRLVCASYQLVPKNVNPQGLTVFMAECQLPYLDEIIRRLSLIFNSLQRIIGYLEFFKY